MILISAGEASGDAVGAGLIAELQRKGCAEQIAAVGSTKLSRAGAEIIEDSSRWGAIGIAQAARVFPSVFSAFIRLKRWIVKHRPNLLIAIDFGAFNVPLCRYAKSKGTKVLYFMPPGSWRKDRQGKNLTEVTDAIATPFEWSAKMLGAHWVGHPLLQMCKCSQNAERNLLAILPGSRTHEAAENLRVMAKAASKLDLSGLTPTIVCAPAIDVEFAKRTWKDNCAREADVEFDACSALCRSRAAIICSGTATLKAAICGTPMVIVYRVPKISELEARLIGFKIPRIGMPNILLDEDRFPELVQHDASPEKIAAHVSELLPDSRERQQQLEALDRIRPLLGPGDALTRTARLAIELLTQSKETGSHRS